MQFGDVLRELLEERGITQRQLGQDLNLAPSTMGNYVRNLREPDYATLKQIAAYFQVSTDYLLDYHSAGQLNHQEARLLRLYHAMDAQTQGLYLDMGALLLRHETPPGQKAEAPLPRL